MKSTFLKITFFMMTITSLIFFSCSKDENSNPSEINRSEFLVGKTSDEIKSSFRKLPVNDKFALWDSKLEQLLSQKLPANQLELIEQLKSEMNNVRIGNQNRFKEIAINLAKITPENDFIQMFSDLSDYKFYGHFNSKNISPKYVIDDLQNLKLNFSVADDSNLKNSLSKTAVSSRDCSCRWSCWMTGGTSSKNCRVTDGGCGFFLMQDCTDYPG